MLTPPAKVLYQWLRDLNVHAAAKVATALERMADGNLSKVKSLGEGF
jgi:hypothetical protein